ncbi:3',5'-cyclic adenosine monophosphate phosphodiesterase CpdA [bioreactor metagenome]|uniref:3',5'-cyclic adenosine monophosphate phosphodiesterase CpdA n=1 Tax=bioreactor metagenome TaxID=1076179 RepID=A0A644YG70_9ZZZZ
MKGIQAGKAGDSLVIRALSPLPAVEITNKAAQQDVIIAIENINPDFYAARIGQGFSPARISVNTLEFALTINAGDTADIVPAMPSDTEDDNYVILGDSRDGYETFDTILSQVNAKNPVFVIDNGDLVYSGKPNQYRIFDEMVSGISSTLCTTLGNHDVRGSGRATYVKLYGPEYYSFDYGENHFIFLDSSRGFTQEQAIPDEQYAWFERDLQKAQGKRIYVVSHVPPTDPRAGIEPNEILAYTDKVKKEGGYIEQKLEAYADNENLDHGFISKKEAEKFETLLAKYHVTTAYFSHIHSYFDYEKSGVRYVISGGAGAELMTRNSYYHYLIAKAGAKDTLTMVQLPSPANLILQRYGATITLFAQAAYRENRAAVLLLKAGLYLLAALVLILLYLKFETRLAAFWVLMRDTGRYMGKRYKELFKLKQN